MPVGGAKFTLPHKRCEARLRRRAQCGGFSASRRLHAGPRSFAGAGIQEMRWSTVGPLCARSHTNHA
jgi:hypothetical protein